MRRVVVTGIGLVTPLAVGVEHDLGAADRRRVGHPRDPVLRRLRSAVQDRRPGAARRRRDRRASTPTDYVDAQGPAQDGRLHRLWRWPRRSQAVEDSGWKPTTDEERERTGVMIGSGIGGLQAIAEAALTLHEKGPRRCQPVLHPVGADQPRLRPGLDPLRLQGPEPRRRHGLLDRRARDRRRGAADRARRRRRDGGRRRRGGDLPARHRRLRRGARAVDRVQRHAGEGLAALGQGPRRLRHGRGRRRRGARGVRARQEARRQDLRRGHRLRHVGRRLPHHRAGRGRRRRLPRDAGGAEARRAQRRTTSTTSTPTAPRRRSATRSSSARSSACSARPPTSSRCPRPSRRSGICWAPPARSRRSSPSWRSATRSCRRRSTSTIRRTAATSTSCRKQAKQRKIRAALSNSFGFGGTNASLIFTGAP